MKSSLTCPEAKDVRQGIIIHTAPPSAPPAFNWLWSKLNSNASTWDTDKNKTERETDREVILTCEPKELWSSQEQVSRTIKEGGGQQGVQVSEGIIYEPG